MFRARAGTLIGTCKIPKNVNASMAGMHSAMASPMNLVKLWKAMLARCVQKREQISRLTI